MANRTIEIEPNPATGRLVSNSGYGALINVTGTNLGDAPPVVLYQDWGDTIVNARASKVPDIGVVAESDNTERCISSWGSKGLGSRTGEGANPRTGLSFIFSAPIKNFYAATDMSIPSGWTFSGAAAPNETPTPLTSALKILWLFDGPNDPVDRADLVIGSWTGAAFQLVGNQSGTSFSGSDSMDFAGWNYFSGYCVAGADPFTQGEWQYQMANANLPNTIWQKSAPAYLAGVIAAQYDRANIYGWSGTNNANDPATSLHVSSFVYVAGSNTDSVKSRIELTNNATYASATKVRPIPPDVWTTTSIKCAIPQHIIDQGFTHYRVITNTNQTIDGAL